MDQLITPTSKLPILRDGILHFGAKHNGERIDDIIQNDLNYCLWMRDLDIVKEDADLFEILKDLKEPPICMPWGKYKGKSIHDLYYDQRDYLKWVKTSDFIRKNKRVFEEICKYV